MKAYGRSKIYTEVISYLPVLFNSTINSIPDFLLRFNLKRADILMTSFLKIFIQLQRTCYHKGLRRKSQPSFAKIHKFYYFSIFQKNAL